MGMRNTKMWHEWLKFVRYIEDNQCFMCVYVYVWYVYVYMCMYVSIMCIFPCMCVYVPIHLCLCMYAHMRVYVFPRVWCVLVYVFNIDVWLNRSVYLSFFLGFFFFFEKRLQKQQAFEQGRKISTTYLQEQNSVWQKLAHSTLSELCGPPFHLVQNCWEVMKAGTWALCCLDKSKEPPWGGDN